MHRHVVHEGIPMFTTLPHGQHPRRYLLSPKSLRSVRMARGLAPTGLPRCLSGRVSAEFTPGQRQVLRVAAIHPLPCRCEIFVLFPVRVV